MPRSLAVISCAVLGAFAITGSLAFAHHATNAAKPVAEARSPQVVAPRTTTAAPALPHAAANASPPFVQPAELRFTNANLREGASIQLYDASGHVDEAAAAQLDALLADARDPKAIATLAIDRRTLQLVVRAALHFRAAEVEVISAYRKPGRRREGLHASGKAIDFKLPGVAARVLAAYLRTLPRVGVGVYTHPKTSYVHLDDREHSFHWLDASPPGRTWRELSIGNASLAQRDAAYRRADDWPEGSTPPEEVPK
jgi:uncharacterized protein YcbK (DUF882 family)